MCDAERGEIPAERYLEGKFLRCVAVRSQAGCGAGVRRIAFALEFVPGRGLVACLAVSGELKYY